jgi:hypothetical protein
LEEADRHLVDKQQATGEGAMTFPIQGLLQDVSQLLQDAEQLLQDAAGGQLSNMLGNAGGLGGNCGLGGGNGNQGVSGSGSITGDPHYVGGKGQTYSVQGQTGGIYNLLSDTGIEVNGKLQAYGNGGAETVGEMGINLNGDDIDIKPGQLTINGQQIDMSKPGSYLNGAVTVNKDGSITVKNDHYTLSITNGGGYLNTNITATNAGRLQQVGGVWGQSLEGGTIDQTPADFQVNSLFANQGSNGGGGSGGGAGGGVWGSIPTNFTPPTLPSNATTQQTLQFEEQMFQYATSVSASTTAINSVGNALKDASAKVAQ